MQQQQPPILFYSPKCPHSTQLIEMIKKSEQLAKSIQPVNIHTARSLPPQLDGVPAILFNNQLLVGPDTFKWVQMASQPRDSTSQGQSHTIGGNHPSTNSTQNQEQNNEELEGIPNPADISNNTKCGINFTHLPGQEVKKEDTTIPRFSFLEGKGTQTDGTVGIDHSAAMEDEPRNRSNGMDKQLEKLQQLRGQDQQTMQGGGYQPRQGAYQQPQGGGQPQGGYGYPQQANDNQMQAPAFGLQNQQNSPYAQQGYEQGGYQNQGQEAMYQHQANNQLPKRY